MSPAAMPWSSSALMAENAPAHRTATTMSATCAEYCLRASGSALSIHGVKPAGGARREIVRRGDNADALRFDRAELPPDHARRRHAGRHGAAPERALRRPRPLDRRGV